MNEAILKWKQKNYFNYSTYDEEEVESVELWDWNRVTYHEFQSLYEECCQHAAMDFDGRILTVFYIEYEDMILLPAAGTKFSRLPEIPVDLLPIAISTGMVYKLFGKVERDFKYLIGTEPPQSKPILNNEYDFRKRIGIDIWKPKRFDKNFGLDIWDKPVYVPLG